MCECERDDRIDEFAEALKLKVQALVSGEITLGAFTDWYKRETDSASPEDLERWSKQYAAEWFEGHGFKPV